MMRGQFLSALDWTLLDNAEYTEILKMLWASTNNRGFIRATN